MGSNSWPFLIENIDSLFPGILLVDGLDEPLRRVLRKLLLFQEVRLNRLLLLSQLFCSLLHCFESLLHLSLFPLQSVSTVLFKSREVGLSEFKPFSQLRDCWFQIPRHHLFTWEALREDPVFLEIEMQLRKLYLFLALEDLYHHSRPHRGSTSPSCFS